MIKAIFFDIDGTLLSHKTKEVPHSTKLALKMLKDKGIYTFVATGRHISELKDLPLDDLDFEGYITLNGQYCYNNKDVIYDLPINISDIKNILQEISVHPFPCLFVEKDIMYMNYHNKTVEIIQNSISSPLPQIGDINRVLTHPIYQIGPYDVDEERTKKLMSIMPHCKKTSWHDLAIDVIPISGGKENGISKVLEYYNIKKEETMAFGDGNNDIDMLEFVEIGIAMGNAKEKVKQCANDITSDIDDDGIYNALIKYKII